MNPTEIRRLRDELLATVEWSVTCRQNATKVLFDGQSKRSVVEEAMKQSNDFAILGQKCRDAARILDDVLDVIA